MTAQDTKDTKDISRRFDSVKVYADKSPVYHQGDAARSIFRVNSGVVMTFRILENGQRQITGFATRGDYIGLALDGEHTEGAVTVTTAGLQSLSITALAADPDLRAQLLADSYRRVCGAQAMLLDLGRKSSHEKVASFLLMLAERRGTGRTRTRQDPAVDVDVTLPMSRLDIADFLGVSRETVSRRLGDLERAGVIRMRSVHTASIPTLNTLRCQAGVAA